MKPNQQIFSEESFNKNVMQEKAVEEREKIFSSADSLLRTFKREISYQNEEQDNQSLSSDYFTESIGQSVFPESGRIYFDMIGAQGSQFSEPSKNDGYATFDHEGVQGESRCILVEPNPSSLLDSKYKVMKFINTTTTEEGRKLGITDPQGLYFAIPFDNKKSSVDPQRDIRIFQVSNNSQESDSKSKYLVQPIDKNSPELYEEAINELHLAAREYSKKPEALVNVKNEKIKFFVPKKPSLIRKIGQSIVKRSIR